MKTSLPSTLTAKKVYEDKNFDRQDIITIFHRRLGHFKLFIYDNECQCSILISLYSQIVKYVRVVAPNIWLLFSLCTVVGA